MATIKPEKRLRFRTTQRVEQQSAGRVSDTTHQRARDIAAPDQPAKPVTAVAQPDGALTPDPLKKPELLQKLSEATGLPKSRIRPVMEAMLAVLGEAVADERPLQLPPLGKVIPLRSKVQGTSQIRHVKIRQKSDKPEKD